MLTIMLEQNNNTKAFSYKISLTKHLGAFIQIYIRINMWQARATDNTSRHAPHLNSDVNSFDYRNKTDSYTININLQREYCNSFVQNTTKLAKVWLINFQKYPKIQNKYKKQNQRQNILKFLRSHKYINNPIWTTLIFNTRHSM